MAEARRVCIAARRKWLRSRRRSSRNLSAVLESSYRMTKRQLRLEINKVKLKAWEELIVSIDKDLWGLPYKLVLDRLRRSSPSLTETMEIGTLNEVLDSLFPSGPVHDPIYEWWNHEVLLTECVVTADKVTLAIRSGGGGNPLPGLDGTLLGVWRRIPPALTSKLASLFSACLRDGVFLSNWKRAKLVLIPKAGSRGNVSGGLSKARPLPSQRDRESV